MTTTTPTAPATLVWLDPANLAGRPGNIRGDLGDLSELSASIRALGVLEPLIVIAEADGGHRVIAGSRRAAAAIAASVTAVPCWERPDLAGVASEVAAGIVENEHRKPLGVAERARAYQQLAIAGLSAAKIAKTTGTKPAAVKKALAVGGSEVATAVTERHDLTLDQALVLAEFDREPEIIKALVVIAVKNPGQWDHAVSRIRSDRAEAAKRQATIDRLTAAGVTIIEEGAVPARTLRLTQLADADRQPLDPEAHVSCPGHAVMLDRWSPERTTAYCVEPDTHGHTDLYARRTAAPTTERGDDGKLTDEAKAERRRVIENNRAWRAAEPVRREYIKALLTRKTAPKGALRYIASEVLGRPERLHDCTDEILADLLGVDREVAYGRHVGRKAVAAAADNRLPLLLLAQVGGAHESTMDVHIWRSAHQDAADWLQFMAATGYTLSPVEQLAVDTANGTAEPHDSEEDLYDPDDQDDDQDGRDAD
jgi:ParB family transcriptional regulator, chromosome partitioning protein